MSGAYIIVATMVAVFCGLGAVSVALYKDDHKAPVTLSFSLMLLALAASAAAGALAS